MSKKQWNTSVAEQWGLFLPPTRPSLSELTVVEKYLLELKSKRKNFIVGILGSTPEYRDLCQTYNANYKCIEYNGKNFSVMRKFLLHKYESENNLLVGDWREMKFSQKFDFIIGDLVTTVTPIKEHETIFKNIQNHCKPGAKVVLKVALRKNNRQLTHKQIFNMYRKKLSHLNPFAAVWHEVLLADYDFVEDTMHCQISLQSLKKSYEKGIINKFEFTEFKKRWDVLGDFKMNIPLKVEYLKKVRKYFKVEKLTSGQDWYKDWVPILILSPKR